MGNEIDLWLAVHPVAKESPIDRLWNRLDGMYPSLWAKNFASDESYQNWRLAWAEAFVEEGITPDEIRLGLANCRKHCKFPPSLPEFMSHCRPPIDYEKAFVEAVQQMKIRKNPVIKNGVKVAEFGNDRWSNPAIYWAAVAIGGDLNRFPYHRQNGHDGLRARWELAVDEAVRNPRGEVPPMAYALPEKVDQPLSKQEVQSRLAAIFAELEAREKQPEQEPDPLLEKLQRGEL